MCSPSKLWRAGLFLALLGPALVAMSAPAAVPVDSFDLGVDLTREGRFDEALDVFLEARAAGDDSGRLRFNLGVVYYRLKDMAAARKAFEQAAEDPETAELARYNLGLVALAAGDEAEAERWFRRTAQEAQQSELRALAQAALDRTAAPKPRRRGSLAALRGTDSNVVVPVGAIDDAPSSLQDQFWELRLGWADGLDAVTEGLGYHFNGLLVAYDDVPGADLSLAQLGLDWRGPVTVDANAAVLAVDDAGYQQSLELRLLATPLSTENFSASLELATVRLDALDRRARDVEGQQHSAGLSLDGRVWRLDWNLGLRHLLNDREARALSPVQDSAVLRLRLGAGRWAGRAWGRYILSDYRVDRRDEASEAGLGLTWTAFSDWDLFVEASRQTNRSSVEGFAYTTDRLYGGVRLRF